MFVPWSGNVWARQCSAWLHQHFDIEGTSKILSNTTHRHQMAWRKATEGHRGWAELRNLPGASMLPRC